VNEGVSGHDGVSAFRRAAERFCGLMERPTDDARHWVGEMLGALALLYAAAFMLPDGEVSGDDADVPESFEVSDGEWRQVFDRVHHVLGRQANYWADFDPSEPSRDDGPVLGDLGDDLADVYRDVKPGVRAWDADGGRWRTAVVSGCRAAYAGGSCRWNCFRVPAATTSRWKSGGCMTSAPCVTGRTAGGILTTRTGRRETTAA